MYASSYVYVYVADIVSSSPAALGKNIHAIEENSVEELPQTANKLKKGQ